MSWLDFVASTEPDKPKPVLTEAFEAIAKQYSEPTREAAAALRDLALNKQHIPPPQLPTPRPSKYLKRPRPNSLDLSVQATVRDLIAPRCLGHITSLKARTEKNSIVLPDEKIADSFLLCKNQNARPAPLSSLDMNKKGKPSMSREGLPSKRTCGGSDRGGRQEARTYEKLLRGPGMWEGII